MADEWSEALFAHAARAVCPPSSLRVWQWWEKEIVLGNDSPVAGSYSTDLTPCVRWVADALQDPYTRVVTAMLSAQSSKTQIGMNWLAYVVREQPGTAMWVGASKEAVEEFGQKRLYPLIRRCPATSDLLPPDRNKQSKRLIQFDSMNLLLRGANSRIGLQSDPVRYIFADERREWKPGRMEMLRKRTSTFHNSVEISMGTPGIMLDELHVDFEDGSQTMTHFRCVDCGHSQPYRFSKLSTVLHRNPSECGGIVWDTNDTTKPNGKYDFNALKKTVRYQCENPKCGRFYHNSDKYRLIKTHHGVDYNPNPIKGCRSFNWNQLSMPWAPCDWAEIATRFLKSVQHFRRGNPEPLIEVVTEDLGEPWDEPTFYRARAIVLTGEAYKLEGADFTPGKFWDKEAVRFMGVDVQLDHFWIVVRVFAIDGTSRKVYFARVDSWADVREAQTRLGVEDARVIVDRRYRPDEVDEHVAYYGWWGCMGSSLRGFSHYNRALKRNIVLPYSLPIGGKHYFFTIDGKKFHCRARWISWSNPTIKGQLYRFQQGKALYWGTPTDSDKRYTDQMNGERLKETSPGKFEWKEVGRAGCHARDCEGMILTAAIADGVLDSGTTVEETAKSTAPEPPANTVEPPPEPAA